MNRCSEKTKRLQSGSVKHRVQSFEEIQRTFKEPSTVNTPPKRSRRKKKKNSPKGAVTKRDSMKRDSTKRIVITTPEKRQSAQSAIKQPSPDVRGHRGSPRLLKISKSDEIECESLSISPIFPHRIHTDSSSPHRLVTEQKRRMRRTATPNVDLPRLVGKENFEGFMNEVKAMNVPLPEKKEQKTRVRPLDNFYIDLNAKSLTPLTVNAVDS